MSPLYWIFLSVFILEKVMELILEQSNVSSIKRSAKNIPPLFAGAIAPEEYSRSQSYSIEKTRLSVISGIYDSVLLLVFLYGGILDRYNTWIQSLSPSLILQGLLFFVILGTVIQILNIPFSLYSQFHLEKKYGFNTMTPGLWIGDFFKSLLLQTILLSALLSGALAIYQASPQGWWLFLWLFFFAFTLFTMYISPYVIEPLFNKFKDLEDPALEQDISLMMQKAGITVAKIQVMDASKRSKHSNAYFTGIGKVKRIVFYDTLIRQMDPPEILAVLAHEAGHWKKKHILKRLISSEVFSLLLFYAVYRIIDSNVLNGVFPMENSSLFSSLMILSFVIPLAGFFLTPLNSWRSRSQEREADDFALKHSPAPSALISALKKLAIENLSNLTPHPFYSRWYYSHPPVTERIQYLQKSISDGI